jgi:DNA-binding response OmpR family regulator
MRVLVVEDEEKIHAFVRQGLESRSFSVTVVEDGNAGFDEAVTGLYDVIVLDIMLPERNGLSVLKELREKDIQTPVIILTARSEANERVQGLELGADDYVTKPFFMDELIARIHAVTRRSSVLHAGKLSLNTRSRVVCLGQEEIILAPREFSVLEHLLRSPGNIFTRDQLLEQVWGYGFDPQTNLVDVCIRRIREKIERDGHKYIETVRGVGYRFNKDEC